MQNPIQTSVLIIGGGVTGTGLARDLSLRGISCLLVEKQDINAGASGGNHGLLHSGARYIASDPASAQECRKEGERLKRLAPHCIEDTGGLFVAVPGDDEAYIADFPRMCAASGIPAAPLDPEEALNLEPALNASLIAAFRVNDAAIDPFRLSLDNMAHARQLGAQLMRFTEVTGFVMDGGSIAAVELRNTLTGKAVRVEAQVVVNATGAWAGKIAALAGLSINMLYSKGSLLVTQNRLTHRVVNRLRPATDADILVPGGTVSILGTTSVRIHCPDTIYPEIQEVDAIISEGAAMVPELETTRYIRAYCGVRPLISSDDAQDDRSVSRGYALIDHRNAGVDNFISITGGKLSTFRLMAEKTADLVCRRLGIEAPCKTHLEPLPATQDAKWTEPGLAPHMWVSKNDPQDLLLCECEMVPQSAVDHLSTTIRAQNGRPTLKALGLRSRIGKGPCQGTFCSQRVIAHLYERHQIDARSGVDDLRDFLNERWRGQRPLLWGMPLIQYELQEALHCGFFGLELEEDFDDREQGE